MVCAFVDVLEAPPSAGVVYENMIEVGASRFDIVDELDQALGGP